MDWLSSLLLKPPPKLPEIVGNAIEQRLDGIGAALTAAVPDVAALGIIFFAAALMVTGDSGRWMGRIALVLWVAITWRILT